LIFYNSSCVFPAPNPSLYDEQSSFESPELRKKGALLKKARPPFFDFLKRNQKFRSEETKTPGLSSQNIG